MQVGNFEISYDKSGNLSLSYNKTIILTKISPILYYNEEYLSEQTGELRFQNFVEHKASKYEDNYDLQDCVELSKQFHVQTTSELFIAILHLFIFPKEELIYINVSFEGNQAKSDKIGGLIDCGIPSAIQSYRFYHCGDRGESLDNKTEQMGMDFFLPGQSSWEHPVFTEKLPNNERLPITYLLGKYQSTNNTNNVFGIVPICRYGQISTIRSCSFLDFPQGIKILSGNYVVQQKYDFLAGAMLGFGTDPLELSRRLFESYMYLINRSYALRKMKEYPEQFEYIGFCTWNTFYGAVSKESIEDLLEGNFNKNSGSDRFRYLIIDDGWQSINGLSIAEGEGKDEKHQTERGLRYFESNYKFPQGLRCLADLIKTKYNLKWLGVWHATFGYWQGVEPNSHLGKKYPIVKLLNSGVPDPNENKGYQFWVDYYAYLRNQHIDILKIDNQSSTGHTLNGYYPLDDIIDHHYNIQQGAAYAQNLKILNCMCMPNYCYTHWKTSNVSRVSDDFSPGNFEMLRRQTKQCVFNPIFYGHFCYPDHDMIQSKPGQNGCPTWPLILVHMVSGSCLYFADEVGETDPKVISRLCFSDGRLPRLDAVGMPTIDAIFRDENTDAASKMWNYHDLQNWGRIFYYYLTNLVNIDKKSIRDHISLLDCGSTAWEGMELLNLAAIPNLYVLKDQESPFTKEVKEQDIFYVDLSYLTAKYYQISPIINGIAILGINETFNGTKAIRKVEWINNNKVVIDPSYTGSLEIYVQNGIRISAKTIEGELLSIKAHPSNPNLWEIAFQSLIILELYKI